MAEESLDSLDQSGRPHRVKYRYKIPIMACMLHGEISGDTAGQCEALMSLTKFIFLTIGFALLFTP